MKPVRNKRKGGKTSENKRKHERNYTNSISDNSNSAFNVIRNNYFNVDWR